MTPETSRTTATIAKILRAKRARKHHTGDGKCYLDKVGQMLESLIERGGYSRNRKRILSKLGISGAALSQYIREQTWPSFSKLLAIADFFDVSLDYLVYGQPTSSLIDYGPLTVTSITPWRTSRREVAVTPPSSRESGEYLRTGSTKSRRNSPRRRPQRARASCKTTRYFGWRSIAAEVTW